MPTVHRQPAGKDGSCEARPPPGLSAAGRFHRTLKPEPRLPEGQPGRG